MPSKNSIDIKYKEFPAVVTSIDEAKGLVKAVVAVFGVIDDGDDIVHPGSFTKTLAESFHRVKVLDQHRTDSVLRVVGKAVSAREVKRDELPEDLLQKFPEATGGLETETQYLINTPEGKGVFDRIQEGALTEYSFGYDIVRADFGKVMVNGKQKTVQNLRELRLWEWSPVIWGMNPATMTVDVKDTATAKEYTGEGPQRRLGEVLIGAVHYQIVDKATSWLEKGYLSVEEYLSLNDVATKVISLIQSKISEDVLLRPLESEMMMDWLFMQRQAASETKGETSPAEEVTDSQDEAGPDGTETEAVPPTAADEETEEGQDSATLAEAIKRHLLSIEVMEVTYG